MRISHATANFSGVLVLAALATFGAGQSGAQSAGSADDTYDWSATLVSFAPESGTAVFEARIGGHAEIEGLDRFQEGDRLTLVWTGRRWAADIRDLVSDPSAAPGPLTLPVEFVATTRDDDYVQFRIRVPASASDALAEIEPGMRVTGISPRGTVSWNDSVVQLRHYNDLGG